MVKILQRFGIFLNNSFRKLGSHIATYTGYFIVIPVLVTIFFLTGIQQLKHEDCIESLFAPKNGRARTERSAFEEYFPTNFSAFEPSRQTHGKFGQFFISASDGGTVMRKDVWDDIFKLHHHVLDITIEDDEQVLKYSDLCGTWNGDCYENRILQLYDLLPELLSGSLLLKYPIMINPYNLEVYPIAMFTGGVEIDEEREAVVYIKYLTIYYWLKDGTERETKRAVRWEEKFIDSLQKNEYKHIKIVKFASTTREREMKNNVNSVIPHFILAVFIMGCFTMISMCMSDWVRAKPILGLFGMLTAGMACITAFGFLMYIGVPFIGINLASPFLMLGIGIDDMFVLLASWRRTNIQDSLVHRMGETYSEAAVSITITSLTNMISFFIGVFTPFLGVQIFSIYTGTAVLVTYIFYITFFGACMAIAGRMEAEQRHSLTLQPVKSKSIADKENKHCYVICCSGGINKDDPWNSEDNKDHALMIFFRDYFARQLNKPKIKVLVLCCYIVYVGGAIYGFINLKEGLQSTHIVRYDSYAVEYFHIREKYFSKYPYRVQVLVTGDLEYGKPEIRNKILKLHSQFEKLVISAGPAYTESWMREWYTFLDKHNNYIHVNTSNEKEFIHYLRRYYLIGSNNKLRLDVKFNDDFSRIVASRFHIQAYNIESITDHKNLMIKFRQIADYSRLNVTVFQPAFIDLDIHVIVRGISFQAVSLAAAVMVIVSLIFIPNAWCSVLIAFSIISIEIGVIGYMSIWGVNLDPISMINLIMCIGFSVDFSAHISYSYLNAKVATKEERVRKCLYLLGLPIVQGAVSTILGVLALLGSSSYIFLTFFKTIFLVVFFGAIHGLVLLPVLLSTFGSKIMRDDDNKFTPFDIDEIDLEAENGQDLVRFTDSKSPFPLKEELSHDLINPFSDSSDDNIFKKSTDNVQEMYNNNAFTTSDDEMSDTEIILFNSTTEAVSPRQKNGIRC